MPPVTLTPETVQIVDDDPSTLTALRRVLHEAGYSVQSFGTSGAWLEAAPPNGSACVVLELSMTGVDGFTMMRSIAARPAPMPVIVHSAQMDVMTAARAMKEGALDYLRKLADPIDLTAAVRRGLDLHAARRRSRMEDEHLRSLFARLTSREREVCEMAASGLLNKQIAGALRLHERTVKLHRSAGMRKLGASSIPDLVRLLDRLQRIEQPPLGER